MTRGLVLPLTLAQVATRAKYLGNLAHAWDLDEHVRNATPDCIDGYYRLDGKEDGLPNYNGGEDPTRCDPFDRWTKPGHDFVNRTADCVGGAAWCGGWDRYQQVRFAHLYDGWINVNSMILDGLGPQHCFVAIPYPVPGCFMVAPTGAPGFEHCGHISTVYSAPPPEHFDHDALESWRHVLAVDVAMRSPNKANAPTTGAVWFGARQTATNKTHYAIFCKSIMAP